MHLRDLSDYGSRQLGSLLEEEASHWREELLWDYDEVSSAVAAGLDRGALPGRVFAENDKPVAYCYYMMDARRAIVGSLFASSAFRSRGLEEQLLEAVLGDAVAQAQSDRVECQTLFSTALEADSRFVRAGFCSRPRHYLLRDLKEPLAESAPRIGLRALRRGDLAAAADIVYQSHRGSVDAALNLTYATPTQCRNFVETLVLRGGCGPFDPDSSGLVEDGTGPVAVLVASSLSPANGHICQVSVLPQAQGRGIGTALVSAALQAFRRRGLSTASLSVTVGNRYAYHLYQRLGFRVRKAFTAHAWVRSPARIELPA